MMKKSRNTYPFYAALCLVMATGSAQGDIQNFDLDLIADDSGRWIDHFSDAFGEIGQGWNGNAANDGFFLYSSLPGYVAVGAGADLFPSEGDLSGIGSIEYDTDTSEVTGLTLDVDDFVARNFSLLENILGAGYETTVSNLSGTVTLVGGEPASFDLVADITFTYGAATSTPASYTGLFSISGDGFSLHVDDFNTVPSPLGGTLDLRYEWDLSGSVSGLAMIPEPGTAVVFWVSGLACSIIRTRRRGSLMSKA